MRAANATHRRDKPPAGPEFSLIDDRPHHDDWDPGHDAWDPARVDEVHVRHAHVTQRPAPRRAVRSVAAVLIPLAVVTLVAMIWLWPHKVATTTQADNPKRLNADIVTVAEQPCPPPAEGSPQPPAVHLRCGTVTIRLAEGPDRGQVVETDIPTGPGAPTVRPGDKVVVLYLPDSPGGRPYQVTDHQRSKALLAIGLAFVFAIVAFGRWRGLTALIGLAVTFAVLLLFIVPAILAGEPPLLVAIVGSAAIMLAVLFLTHGFNLTTAIAVLGTLASLTLTGLLSALCTAAAKLTGVASEEASFLNNAYQNVNMRGLLLAGILIGSLGVLDDICVTQATTVSELAAANPELGPSGLYRAATRVGRAHIASVINTIILAYAGSSLPLLILFAAGNVPVGELLTGQFVAEELVRSAVGTIGLVAAVPITTALAALTARQPHGPLRHPTSSQEIDGLPLSGTRPRKGRPMKRVIDIGGHVFRPRR